MALLRIHRRLDLELLNLSGYLFGDSSAVCFVESPLNTAELQRWGGVSYKMFRCIVAISLSQPVIRRLVVVLHSIPRYVRLLLVHI